MVLELNDFDAGKSITTAHPFQWPSYGYVTSRANKQKVQLNQYLLHFCALMIFNIFKYLIVAILRFTLF
jgi:hypothetical protein